MRTCSGEKSKRAAPASSKCCLTRLGLLPTTTSRQQLRWSCSGRVCTARYATVNAPRDRMSKYNQIFTARCFSSLFTNHQSITNSTHTCVTFPPFFLTWQHYHQWRPIRSPAELQKRSSAETTRRTRPQLAEASQTQAAHVAEPSPVKAALSQS